ncbi:MAG: zf-HC2 domain-containing protein [Planctomycetes bacterium]|nr:zf-HC2 domain-containing protein [Planctomycetota bacterium]
MKCKWQDEIIAYLQNELDEAPGISFEQHLKGCPDCSKRLDDYRQINQKLKCVPQDTVKGNIQEKVLAAIKSQPSTKPQLRRDNLTHPVPSGHPSQEGIFPQVPSKKRGFRGVFMFSSISSKSSTFLRLVIAAGILLLLGAGIFILSQSREIKPVIQNTPACATADRPANSETITKALDWLANNQDETGKWPAEKWGGDKQYEIALTGLSIMALDGAEPNLRKRYVPNIDKGIKYLIDRQSADGSFGPKFTGTPYNHGIATVCLLENYALSKDNKLKAPVNGALNYISWTQKADGGWGYLASQDELPNTAVSFWSIHALLLANSMDFGDLTPSIKKGFEWLSGISDETGRPGYSKTSEFPYGAETLSAMTAFCYTYGGEKYLPDKEKYRKLFNYLSVETTASNEVNYYRSYFMSYVRHPSMDAWRNNLFATLSKTQCQADILTGSWDPSDKWGEVGGRVYTTALASLSLEATTRGERLKNQFTTR